MLGQAFEVIQDIVKMTRLDALEDIDDTHHLGRYRLAGKTLECRVISLVGKLGLWRQSLCKCQFSTAIVKQVADLQLVDDCAYRCRVLACLA